MDAQEVTGLMQNFEQNAVAGFALILYYLAVNWSRIRDGLGIRKKQESYFEREKKHYELLKLKIEIEALKRDTGLDAEFASKLEAETREQLASKPITEYSNTQKFVAIPLMLLATLLSFMELEDLDQTPDTSAIDILSGYIFVIVIIIIGFWGLRKLKTLEAGPIRTTGYIAYWTMAFYILAYMFATLIQNLTGIPATAEVAAGWYLIIAFVVSVAGGLLGRLPGMRQ